MPIIKINPTIIKFSPKIQNLCLQTSKSFPKGCPNYAKKSGCPPQPLINEIFDFQEPMYLIYTDFDIKKVAKRMRTKHHDWTIKQCHNPRYWQGTARKQHKLELEKFLQQYPEATINKNPEAHGVNVNNLMNKIGINLEWPPRKLSRIISLGGYTP